MHDDDGHRGVTVGAQARDGSAIALAGIGLVAMPTGILASSFAEEFRERHERAERAAAARRGAAE